MQRVQDINLDENPHIIRWYYDACTLTNKEELVEILNAYQKRNVVPIISHLCIGEAFANSHLKSQERLEAFMELMRNLRDHINIVGNDGIDSQLEYVREIFPSLSITDKIHLATALRHKCEIINTKDGDFLGQSKRKLDQLANKCGFKQIRVRRVG
ncbi:PIN domain-containing protein [Candidatus Woesearchaeota archaeon]|nr:PIN domain-containing protein [Candidatus Woesearchaeota archaeon]